MIRYSTQPDKGSKALTDSPTSPIVSTKDTRNLLNIKDGEKTQDALDLDANDVNE
jgi:hypothetical protein